MNKRKQGTATRTPRCGRAVKTPAGDPEHKSGSGVFALASECTVADASSLKSSLAKLLDDSGVVTLDVGALQRIDTAGLQVIATFVRERESHGREVQWLGTAQALSNAAQLLGLSSLLKLPTPAEQAVENAP
jgi:ABC-type transporter Mla MlaB component